MIFVKYTNKNSRLFVKCPWSNFDTLVVYPVALVLNTESLTLALLMSRFGMFLKLGSRVEVQSEMVQPRAGVFSTRSRRKIHACCISRVGIDRASNLTRLKTPNPINVAATATRTRVERKEGWKGWRRGEDAA